MAKEQPQYVEESLGLHLSHIPATFSPDNKSLFVVSENCIFVFNPKTGKRQAILRHDEEQLAVGVFGGLIVSVTVSGTLLHWDLATQSVIAVVRFNEASKLAFAYINPEGFYVLSHTKTSTVVSKLLLKPDGSIANYKTLGEMRNHLMTLRSAVAITDFFAVAIVKKRGLTCFSFDGTKNDSQKFMLTQQFPNLVKQSTLCFMSLEFVNGVLYAALNTGRIYYWKKFAQTGFDPKQQLFFHRNPSAAAFAIGAHGAIFSGDGEAIVRKWNVGATGTGRWEHPDGVEKFDAPVRNISLSPDGTLLSVQLEDNTIWIVQTTSMTILSELQTMQWMPIANQIGLRADPLRPDLVLSAGRVGHVQWFDPTKWRTVAFFDVTDEDTPPRDNKPYGYTHNWLNVYQINATPTTLVTVERRRQGANEPSTIKFFRRNPKTSLADLKQEDAIELDHGASRIMSTHDDLSVDEAFAALKEEEIVVVDITGRIAVFMRDMERSGRWLLDLSRCVEWMGSKVTTTSSVRNDCFAAVHTVNGSNFVLIWRVENLTIHETLDSLVGVTAVEWAPLHGYDQKSENVLLMVTTECVTAFDVLDKQVLWIIAEPNLSLFASLDVACCYNDDTVYVVDPLTGALELTAGFQQPQCLIVANVVDKNNIRFVGGDPASISLLKQELPENEIDREVVATSKRTPFSTLIEHAMEKNAELSKIQTVKVPSFRKKFDGPVFASAPLLRLGPEFIRDCFMAKNKDDFDN
uniref:WD_REPEATS_REGION domain-containing protein n=1 Tax=Panagrellus redivivus TaxID=6233 RepID=A0A7E4V688_PANRE